MPSNYEPIGKHIRLVDVRNKDLKIERLVGLSISKQFIPSVANIIGTDMTNYKIIKKGQFACSVMQVRRDKKMPVALMEEYDEAIISQAYPVFEVMDETKLLPEYLMMWFTRSEFDRHACFLAVGGVRGSLEWDDFLEMELPVPHIAIQRAMVKEYNTITNRIALNELLNQKLEETAQTLYKQWFVDFEFPYDFEKDEPSLQGKPYKSNGGQMEWCEELEKEVPRGWKLEKLENVARVKAGGDKPRIYSASLSETCQVPIYSNSSANEGLFGYTDEAKVFDKSVTISARGAIIGFTVLRTKPFVPIVRLIVVTPNQEFQVNYIYEVLRGLKFDGSASAQGQLTKPDVSAINLIVPEQEVLEKFQNISFEISQRIELNNKGNIKLETLSGLLLSKMSTVETGVVDGVVVG